MRRNNDRTDPRKQRRQATAKVRRLKRKQRLRSIFEQKARPLLMRLGALQQEVSRLTKELEAHNGGKEGTAGSGA